MGATEHAGSRAERYTTLRHLASGGMAEIHLALTHGIEGFEKLVILKRILPNLAHDEEFVRMFLDEARVAATLHHPNIVQVYDIGRDDHGHFFTMEYVYGADLSHILRRAAEARRPLSLDHALTIILGTCAGLHHAHEKEGLDGKPLGMVHRDVSPQNVLISYDGAVKVVDFGIAKAATRTSVTRDGSLKGKIAYMSPEQVRSRPLDRRSDVFSLSIMLWELTTFRRLYRAPSDFETLQMITGTDAPPPSRFRPGYPAALERIVMKGLRRDPAERYQTVEELQVELEELARELKLMISSVPLGRFVRGLFRDQLDAWSAAQQRGLSFPKFLATSDLLPPSSPTDTWVAPPSDEIGAHVPDGRDTPPPFELPALFPVEEAPPPRRRWGLVTAIVGVALAAGIGVVIVASGGKEPTPATEPGPTTESSAPPPTNPVAQPEPDAAVAEPEVATSVPVEPGPEPATEPPPETTTEPATNAEPATSATSPPKPRPTTSPRPRPTPKPAPKPTTRPSSGLDDLLPN